MRLEGLEGAVAAFRAGEWRPIEVHTGATLFADSLHTKPAVERLLRGLADDHGREHRVLVPFDDDALPEPFADAIACGWIRVCRYERGWFEGSDGRPEERECSANVENAGEHVAIVVVGTGQLVRELTRSRIGGEIDTAFLSDPQLSRSPRARAAERRVSARLRRRERDYG